MKTRKLFTKTIAEWEKLGPKDGKFKNPETGEYTLVRPMQCFACWKTIPSAGMPETRADAAGSETDGLPAKRTCPECGNNAYPPR